MKIIKRDGRIVDFDRQKIMVAIQKANEEVRGRQKASKEDIKGIVNYIEDLDIQEHLLENKILLTKQF